MKSKEDTTKQRVSIFHSPNQLFETKLLQIFTTVKLMYLNELIGIGLGSQVVRFSV